MRLVRACGLALLVVVAAAGLFGGAGAAAPAANDAHARASPGGSGGPAAHASGDGQSMGTALQMEADRIEFRIVVHANASAQWRFTYTRVLENDTERERFRAFAREFNENETDGYRQFRRQATSLAAAGRNATGREMRAVDFGRHAELGGNCIPAPDEECGTVRMSFTWTGFAHPVDDRLVVDDVFGDGLFITDDQELVFEAGEGLAFRSADPDTYTPSGASLADSDTITYAGEQSFSDNRPRVAFVPADSVGDGTGTTAATGGTASGDGTTTGGETSEREGGLPVMLVGGVFALVVAVGAAAMWFRRGGGPTIDAGGGGGGAGASARSRAGSGSAREPGVSEEELLTDEDRVEKLLRENGGRMKQVDIVEATGWSKSKVSMLLSDMEDAEEISKLRVGRENIISLAGHEPEAAGSPHDED